MAQSSARALMVVYAIVVVAIAGAATLLLQSRPEPVEIVILPPVPTAIPLPTVTPSPITVYVTGAVAQPETLVQVAYDARVTDAITAAGGMLPQADAVRVNLAGLLRDGDQVHVPFLPPTPTVTVLQGGIITQPTLDALNELPTPMGGYKVNINTATLEELMTLPRIGEVMAQRIITYRESNGAFQSAQDLLNVEGIGEKTLENLTDLITLD